MIVPNLTDELKSHIHLVDILSNDKTNRTTKIKLYESYQSEAYSHENEFMI